MSSKTLNIFSELYDTYADALYKYLNSKGIEIVWLAKKITPKDKKVGSTQEKISRWKREGTKPSDDVRNKISEILGISIDMNAQGKWSITRTNDPTVANADQVDLPANGKLSRDHHVRLLRQIESIARLLADNIESK